MLRKVIYTLMCTLSIGIYTRQQLGLPLLDWVNNYVNDFLCIPIVLGIITQLVRWMKKDVAYNFSFIFILCLATFYSVYFEYYLPKHNPRYTGDWIDVLLYFLGGVCYFLVSRLQIPGLKVPQEFSEEAKRSNSV